MAAEIVGRIRRGIPAGEEPFDINPEIFTLVGRCIVFWNRIEFEIEACIALMLMPQSTILTSALTAEQPVRAKFASILILADATPAIRGPLNDQLKKLVSESRKYNDQRNWVAHGRWQHQDAQGRPTSGRVFLTPESTKSIDDLRILGKNLGALLWRWTMLRAGIGTSVTLHNAGL